MYGAARIGSFVGFAPYEDPKLAIVVVVDEPQGPINTAVGCWSSLFLDCGKIAPVFRRDTSKTPEQNEPAVTDTQVAAKTVESTEEMVFQSDGWTMPTSMD